MICEVMFKCGHLRTIEVTGQTDARRRKIAHYNRMLCPECRHEMAAGACLSAPMYAWTDSEGTASQA